MVELRPLGVRCNIQCQYCYQNPQRDAGNYADDYDLEQMKAAIALEGGPFALFGGEPLLVPIKDLEQLWAWGLARFGHNALQTNGTLITEDHVRMFKQYNVSVGISVDGPGELNDVRWHGTIEKTRESTEKAEQAISRLCQEGRPPSLIVTLHRVNASPQRLPQLYTWMSELEAMGIRSVRLHLLESENEVVRTKYALSIRENIAVLLGLLELQRSLPLLTFDLFTEMRLMLKGEDQNTSCVWNACDPYTTEAVRGVEGHGQRSNCGRTNKDGIDFGKGNVPGFERYIALYQTPQQYGGCSGCRFFLMCKGHCPGTAIDGDWRNRTEHCEVWKAIYTRLEADLLAEGQGTLSLSSQREYLERALIDSWSQGRTGVLPR
ncbi:MAG: radical SAM protein [Nitrospira sp. WS110]|nr:radical SAM protein [Nitrospira sp. WS110]